MKEQAAFMVVDSTIIENVPKAFRDYVFAYFAKKYVLRVECYVAFLVKNLAVQPLGIEEIKPEPGVAPLDADVLAKFTDGLREGEALIDWISANVNTLPGLGFYASMWEALPHSQTYQNPCASMCEALPCLQARRNPYASIWESLPPLSALRG